MADLAFHDVDKILRYDPETGDLYWKERVSRRQKPGDKAGGLNNSGYMTILIKRKRHSSHRLAWLLAHGEWPNIIDHKNGDRSDNRLANLRNTNRTMNCYNAALSKNNTSGCKGVTFNKSANLWQAAVGEAGRRIYIGVYKTAEEASAAYLQAVEMKAGEFALHRSRPVSQPPNP